VRVEGHVQVGAALLVVYGEGQEAAVVVVPVAFVPCVVARTVRVMEDASSGGSGSQEAAAASARMIRRKGHGRSRLRLLLQLLLLLLPLPLLLLEWLLLLRLQLLLCPPQGTCFSVQVLPPSPPPHPHTNAPYELCPRQRRVDLPQLDELAAEAEQALRAGWGGWQQQGGGAEQQG